MIRGQGPESSFALPGGWLLGDALDAGQRCETAVLRPLTGHEEEWLAQHRGAPSATIASQILDACVLRLDDREPPRDFARRMLVGDRDYLMLQLRRLMNGDKIQAIMACPACSAKMDVDVDAGQIPVEGIRTYDGAHELALQTGARVRARNIRFRLPTGGDQEAVVGLPVDAAGDELLRRCLLEPCDPPLDDDEKAAVIAAMEERAPRVEIELELTCPECAQRFLTPFDTTTFFLSEMRISAAQLLREVHTLAFYYHWSESDILNLTRDRRRSYLALL